MCAVLRTWISAVALAYFAIPAVLAPPAMALDMAAAAWAIAFALQLRPSPRCDCDAGCGPATGLLAFPVAFVAVGIQGALDLLAAHVGDALVVVTFAIPAWRASRKDAFPSARARYRG